MDFSNQGMSCNLAAGPGELRSPHALYGTVLPLMEVPVHVGSFYKASFKITTHNATLLSCFAPGLQEQELLV